MKKIAIVTAKVGIVMVGLMSVLMVGYGLYQQSQLYPRINQELGYQQCIAQVNAEVQKQQQEQQNSTVKK